MKAVIVEDEILSARNLQQILDEIGDIDVISQLDSIEDTVDWFSNHPDPDVLFLDIHLADGSAFEIFGHLEITCPIVFTTAYDEYALHAFKVNSISYLLKPLKKEDVREALRKLKTLRAGSNNLPDDLKNLLVAVKSPGNFKTHFLVSSRGDKLLPLKVAEIACVHIEEGLVKAHTYDQQVYFLDQTLDELILQLNPINFFRANRQYIIARNAVKDIDQWFNNRLSLNLTIPIKEKILISRAKIPDFKDWFTGPEL